LRSKIPACIFLFSFSENYGILTKSIGGRVHAALVTYKPYFSVASEGKSLQRVDDVCSLGLVPFFRNKRIQVIPNSR
jgi:hypothetical protein